MKKLLISTACAIFICGNGLAAREVTLSPTFTLHGSTIFAARHVAQSNSAVGATGELLYDGVHFNPRRQSGCVPASSV